MEKEQLQITEADEEKTKSDKEVAFLQGLQTDFASMMDRINEEVWRDIISPKDPLAMLAEQIVDTHKKFPHILIEKRTIYTVAQI